MKENGRKVHQKCKSVQTKDRFFTESLGGANKGLGEAPEAARGRSMKARPTQSRKGVKGGLRPFSSAPCRVKGQRPLWGLGQRPNCSASDQSQGSRQQRCRQRSVPAPNFARPQTRPQAALPPRFREKPKNNRRSHAPEKPNVRKMSAWESFCPVLTKIYVKTT